MQIHIANETAQHRGRRWINSIIGTTFATALFIFAVGGIASATQLTSATKASSTQQKKESSTAQKALNEAEKYPTKLALPPLKTKPKAGGSIVFTSGGTPQEQQVYESGATAAKSVGWTASEVTFDPSNPATLIAALQSALLKKPTAVMVVGEPYSLWSSEIPAYKAAGVSIIAFATGAIPSNPVVRVNIQGPPDTTHWAQMLSSWFIANSKAKGRALVVDYPSLGAFKAQTTALLNNIKKSCKSCDTTTLNLPISQLGTSSVSPIVSALQASPSIKYVLVPYGLPIDGIGPALKTAGLSGVEIAGSSPTLVNLQSLLTGETSAWVANGYNVVGYMVVDSALRIAEAMPVPTGDGGQPTVLLVKTNVGTPSNNTGNVPTDYVALFHRLWHVG